MVLPDPCLVKTRLNGHIWIQVVKQKADIKCFRYSKISFNKSLFKVWIMSSFGNIVIPIMTWSVTTQCLRHRWQRICSVYHRHNPVLLLSFMTSHNVTLTIVCLFVPFLAMVLSVLQLFTASVYHLGIFKLF